jgi:hypothetical protein
MSLSRPTASSITKKVARTAGVVAALLGFAAVPAMAAEATIEPVKLAPANVSAALAVCPGQTFSQPFAQLNDDNYYTLVEGSEFNAPEEGWQLSNGAQIVAGTRPDGSSGGVLDLPTGAYAVSPPVCVTLQYPTARGWVEAAQGTGAVTVGVYYAGSRTLGIGQVVGQLAAKAGQGWELSSPFAVRPQLTGKEEGVREVRFVYANLSRASDFHMSGLYVDPRMS